MRRHAELVTRMGLEIQQVIQALIRQHKDHTAITSTQGQTG